MSHATEFEDSSLRGMTVVTSEYAVATADRCDPRLNPSLRDLLARVRKNMGIDVALIVESINDRDVMRHVDSTFPGLTIPGESGPLAVASVFGTESLISTPILLHNGRLFGTLCCLNRPAGDSTESFTQALRDIATLVAASVDPPMEAPMVDISVTHDMSGELTNLPQAKT